MPFYRNEINLGCAVWGNQRLNKSNLVSVKNSMVARLIAEQAHYEVITPVGHLVSFYDSWAGMVIVR